ncbi:MAG: methionyl-tRNA formyltransferase [Elusimicrobiota bacterium]|jgi:methionyl-tRNA formyltransferase|nr:methionyl-tRNA formyltransferase [Elusimicrobiota bacterium]
MLKTVFFGAPDIAVPFLERLHALSSAALVITQPDRPCGRGLAVAPCPVKTRALQLGLPVISPEIFKTEVPRIAALGADLGLAVAYGKIFRRPAIDAFKYGIINIHFSLLPRYRGASPVQQALFDGHTQTGVCAFWIDEGLDTGPIAAQTPVPINAWDDAKTLFPKLIDAGCDLLQQVLKDIKDGKIIKTPQQGAPTFAKLINKEDTLINFGRMTAGQIHNLVRGLALGIPAHAKAQTLRGDIVQILQTALPPADFEPDRQPAGAIVSIERGRGFFVQCCEGVLLIESLRPAGKNAMGAAQYANGRKLSAGMFAFK